MPLLHQRLIAARVWYFDRVIRARLGVQAVRGRAGLCRAAIRVCRRIRIVGGLHLHRGRLNFVEFVTKLFVQQDARGCLLVGAKYLLAEHIHKLVEAQIHFGLDLVVQVTLLEDCQGVHGRVIVQIQRVEDKSEYKHF